METIERSLVSVCIVTYNSALTVIETLESVKSQTYADVELIVSDDCSTDDTVQVIRNWLQQNSCRFVHTELLVVESNTGVAGNCNRACRAANGKWIKILAGDDKLYDTYVEKMLDYISDNPESEIVFSRMTPFGAENLIRLSYGYFNLSHKAFKYKLLLGNFLQAPAAMIRKSTYDELGGFDETIPFIEDWPFWIHALMENKNFSFNDVPLVYYRVSENSLSVSARPSDSYQISLKLANEYALEQQRNTSFLLWMIGKAISYGNGPFMKILMNGLRLLNPLTYYIKYNDWRAECIDRQK